jgi:hypothetical protein
LEDTFQADFAAGLHAQKIKVIITAVLRHQAQVAPITKGSRNVRYIENNTPNNASAHRRIVAALFHFLGPYLFAIQTTRIET